MNHLNELQNLPLTGATGGGIGAGPADERAPTVTSFLISSTIS